MNKMKWRELAIDPMFNLESFLDLQDKTIEEKDKEIDRLNNIINDYEKWLNDLGAWCYVEKLKELKESDNNEKII